MWNSWQWQRIPAVHVSDLTTLYLHILQKIFAKEDIPNGENGYYFAVAHEIGWWEILDQLTVALHARGLVTDKELRIWPNDDMVAEALGFPVSYVRIVFDSG